MVANHTVIGFGKLDRNRTKSEDDITLKQNGKEKNYIIPYLRIIDHIVSLRMGTGRRNTCVVNLMNTKNSSGN